MSILSKIPTQIVELLVVAALATSAGTLTLAVWRKSWMTPVAGLILGCIFGYGAVRAGVGGGWIVAWTMIGAIAGPNIAVIMQGEGFARLVVNELSRRFGIEPPTKPKP